MASGATLSPCKIATVVEAESPALSVTVASILYVSPSTIPDKSLLSKVASQLLPVIVAVFVVGTEPIFTETFTLSTPERASSLSPVSLQVPVTVTDLQRLLNCVLSLVRVITGAFVSTFKL